THNEWTISVKTMLQKFSQNIFRSALDCCFRKPLKSLTAYLRQFASQKPQVLRSRLCHFSVPLSRTGPCVGLGSQNGRQQRTERNDNVAGGRGHRRIFPKSYAKDL